MSKSGGVFQFFGGRMTSRGQCPRGWVLVNVFTPPPPPFRKSCIRAWIGTPPPQSFTLFRPLPKSILILVFCMVPCAPIGQCCPMQSRDHLWARVRCHLISGVSGKLSFGCRCSTETDHACDTVSSASTCSMKYLQDAQPKAK